MPHYHPFYYEYYVAVKPPVRANGNRLYEFCSRKVLSKPYTFRIEMSCSAYKIILYGSYSRNEQTKDNNIDIAVIFNGFIGDWLKASHIQYHLSDKFKLDDYPEFMRWQIQQIHEQRVVFFSEHLEDFKRGIWCFIDGYKSNQSLNHLKKKVPCYNHKGWRKYKRSNRRTARRKLKNSQYWI